MKWQNTILLPPVDTFGDAAADEAVATAEVVGLAMVGGTNRPTSASERSFCSMLANISQVYRRWSAVQLEKNLHEPLQATKTLKSHCTAG